MAHTIQLVKSDGSVCVLETKILNEEVDEQTEICELVATKNHDKYFIEALDRSKGFEWLYGKKAKRTLKRLRIAIRKLGVKEEGNHFDMHPGFAGYTLQMIYDWAKANPDCVFRPAK